MTVSDNNTKNISKNQKHSIAEKFKLLPFGEKMEKIILCPFFPIINQKKKWEEENDKYKSLKIRGMYFLLVITIIPALLLFAWLEYTILLAPFYAPILFILHKKWEKELGLVEEDIIEEPTLEQPILQEQEISLEQPIPEKQIKALNQEIFETKYYLKQKIISLEKFNLEYQYDNLNNNEIKNILDLYHKNYNEKIDDKKSKINLFTGISLVIIFGLLALIIFVSTFISIVQSTINSKGQSFKIDLYQVLVSNNTSGTIQYIPTPLQLLYAIINISTAFILLFIIGILLPSRLFMREIQRSDYKHRKNYNQWNTFANIITSLQIEEKRKVIKNKNTYMSNYALESSILDTYLSLNKNKKILRLKAIDPDWELYQILSIFIKSWDITSLCGITFWILITLVSAFSIYNPNDPFFVVFFSVLLLIGLIVAFYYWGIWGYGGQLKSSYKYYSIRAHLIKSMKLQILELSNKELVSYSGTIADEPEKLNIKLELLSARSTLSSLEKLPIIPNFDKIVQLTKISGIISLVSVLYSILIL